MKRCRTGKMVFQSRGEAKAYVREIRKRSNRMRACDPYRCPICDQWHLTSLSKAQQRSMRRHRAA